MDSAFYVCGGPIRFIGAHARALGPRFPACRPANCPDRARARADPGRDRARGELAVRPDHVRDPAAGADRAARGEHGSRAAGAKRRVARCDARGRGRRALDPRHGVAGRPQCGRAAGRARQRGRRQSGSAELSAGAAGRRLAGELLRHRAGRRLPHGDGVPFPSGRFLEPGPATVWMRMRASAGRRRAAEPVSACAYRRRLGQRRQRRARLVAFSFINVDLSVHLHRMPASEWVCLDAITVPEPTGIGLADTALHDERGPIGRAFRRSSFASAEAAPLTARSSRFPQTPPSPLDPVPSPR